MILIYKDLIILFKNQQHIEDVELVDIKNHSTKSFPQNNRNLSKTNKKGIVDKKSPNNINVKSPSKLKII